MTCPICKERMLLAGNKLVKIEAGVVETTLRLAGERATDQEIEDDLRDQIANSGGC